MNSIDDLTDMQRRGGRENNQAVIDSIENIASKKEIEPQHNLLLGRAYRALGEEFKNQAMSNYSIALGDDESEIDALIGLADLARYFDDNRDRARGYLAVAEDRIRQEKLAMSVQQAKLFLQEGFILRMEGKYDDAIMVHDDGLSICSYSKDKDAKYIGALNRAALLGDLFMKDKKTPTEFPTEHLIEVGKRAEAYFQSKQYNHDLVNTLAHLSWLYNKKGDAAEEIKYLKKGLQISVDIDMVDSKSALVLLLLDAYRRQGDRDSFISLDKQHKDSEKIINKHYQALYSQMIEKIQAYRTLVK